MSELDRCQPTSFQGRVERDYGGEDLHGEMPHAIHEVVEMGPHEGEQRAHHAAGQLQPRQGLAEVLQRPSHAQHQHALCRIPYFKQVKNLLLMTLNTVISIYISKLFMA